MAALLGASALGGAAAQAAAPPVCALTTGAATPAPPSAGAPCWTDFDPYPFGADGEPVDPTSAACSPLQPPGPNYAGDRISCYLQVDSMAFRAWNRGLATTRPAGGGSTPFGVWLFNGARWYPDPTFPGQSVCQGKTVVWAGKLDYWLIGNRTSAWPSLCRFDAANFAWEPLPVPPATLARVPLDAVGRPQSGAISSGACFAWDNCWFFGNYGTVVHWDGQALSDASLSLAAGPWLQGSFTAAVARTDAAGNPFGFAVGTTGTTAAGEQLPAQPDGSPPPQLFESNGAAFSPLSFSPPTAPQPGDPYRTDLVALDFDASGGWVAGDPTGYQPASAGGSTVGTRRIRTPQPAPLTRLAPDGAAAPCGGYDAGTFQYDSGAGAGYLWSSISVFPGTDAALAGGQFQPAAAGAGANDDGQPEPALVAAACGSAPALTRFRVADPLAADQAHAGLVPADRLGWTTSVAVNAPNDAWAATTYGTLVNPGASPVLTQRPHVYRLTDGRPPLAPVGDDDERRKLVFQLDPPIILQAPPTYIVPETPGTTKTKQGPKRVHKVKLKAAIYAIHHQPLSAAGGGTFKLTITFRVRRAVTIGLQGLRGHKVVTASGLKHFKGKRGRLVLKLDPRRWPTRIRFVIPTKRKH